MIVKERSKKVIGSASRTIAKLMIQGAKKRLDYAVVRNIVEGFVEYSSQFASFSFVVIGHSWSGKKTNVWIIAKWRDEPDGAIMCIDEACVDRLKQKTKAQAKKDGIRKLVEGIY